MNKAGEKERKKNMHRDEDFPIVLYNLKRGGTTGLMEVIQAVARLLLFRV